MTVTQVLNCLCEEWDKEWLTGLGAVPAVCSSGNGIAMELVHWVNHTSPETWMDPPWSASIHDILFSLENKISLIAQAHFSHIDGASAAFFSGDWFGYPKKQQGVPGALPVPQLTYPQACTQTAVFPLQCPSAPYLLLSSLSGATRLLHSHGMSGP